MRIAVFSDMHLETVQGELNLPEADAYICAGDLWTKGRGVQWLASRAQGRPAFYVCGNHEGYGSDYPRLIAKMRDEGKPVGVHVLDRETASVGRVRIIGATLWTDMGFFGDVAEGARVAEAEMRDYKKIRLSGVYRRLKAQDTVRWHRDAVRYIETESAKAWDGPTIIVTHHSPSVLGIAPEHRADPVSVAYASNMDELVAGTRAAYWVHGHTHYCHETRVGDTVLLSNTRGYDFERAVGFRPDLTIDL